MIWTEGNTVDFAFTGCTGDVTWCGIWDAPHHGASLHPTVAIAPGASRTVALTYRVASYTVCVVPANMRFYLYEYHETATGSAELFEFEAQMTNVEC
jgi:hypothetical protein